MRRRRSTSPAADDALPPGGLVYQPAEVETEEIRGFLAREWPAADRDVFGPDGLDWTSRPVVVEARDGGELVAVAVGEVVAGTARLGDILVARSQRSVGVGGRLLELFCERAAAAGAARCYLRCPDTARHRRFYQRHGFARIARLPRYYHGKDFLEYLREPLLPPAGRRGRHARGSGGLKSEAGTEVAGGHAGPSGSPPGGSRGRPMTGYGGAAAGGRTRQVRRSHARLPWPARGLPA